MAPQSRPRASRVFRSSAWTACAALALLAGSAPASSAADTTGPLRNLVSNVLTSSAWLAKGNGGAIGVSTVGIAAPDGSRTGTRLTRWGGSGTWAYAMAPLASPQQELLPGRTYRLQAWVRDLNRTGSPLRLLLANGNYSHRPSDASIAGGYTDGAWHLLQRTFTVRTSAFADTALYLELPPSGAMAWDVASPTVAPVAVPLPAKVSTPPTQTVTFGGPAGAAPDSRVWGYDTGGGGWGNRELETYTSRTSNASLDGQGHLAITARRETLRGTDGITRQYTSARLNSAGKFTVPTGSYVEAPIKAPVGGGVWPAFWMMGVNTPKVGWPAGGEVDILEGQGSSPTTALRAIHAASTSNARADVQLGWGDEGGRLDLGQPLDAGFHLYGIYFDKDLVRLYVDRKPVMTLWAADAPANGMTWPFAQSQYLLLNVAVGNGDPSATSFPRTMQVGTISVWKGGTPF